MDKKYLGYNSNLKPLAQKNRKVMNMTKAERFMWYMILNKKRTGYTFLRQKPIENFILDFYCSKLLIAVEIDGSSHQNRDENDCERDTVLMQYGIRTIRYENELVLRNPEGVFSDICKRLEERVVELMK